MKNNDRKEELLKLCLDDHDSNKPRIYCLIKNNCLDKVIAKITDVKTIPNVTTMVKNGFLNGNEQFLEVLDEFIYYFDTNLAPIVHKDVMLQYIFESQIPEFLLCKKYWGDNSFIPYYSLSMKATIVNNFYNNILRIYNFIDKRIFDKAMINNNMNLSDIDDVDKIFKFLKLISFTNIGEYAMLYLFKSFDLTFNDFKESYRDKSDDEIKTIILDDYIIHYEILFNNYNKKKKYAELLIKC